MAKKNGGSGQFNPVLAENRKARHDYTILETMEAGIELVGTEVKSCRDHKIALADAFVRIDQNQAFLENVHIAAYDFGNRFNHAPRQKRRLLLHKKELRKLSRQIKERGLTLIPLKFYLKGSLVKVEVALCKGKDYGDKRETMRERQDKLDAQRAMRNYSR